MITFKCVYRFASTGEVEGFVGRGPTTAEARQDAINQVGRKLRIIRESGANKNEEFEPGRLLDSAAMMRSKLSEEERKLVKADWNTSVRY